MKQGTNRATVIGLCGFAGSGKSTASQYIEAAYGVERRPIGRPMKDMLAAIGLTPDELDGERKELPSDTLLGATPREAMIALGTDWGRNRVHPDFWVSLWRRSIKSGERVANDSVRFPNEIEAIRQLGGIMIRIDRPGVGPVKFRWGLIGRWLYERFGIMAGVHASERIDRLDVDFVVENDGGLLDLADQLDIIMKAALAMERLRAAA